MVEPPPFKFLGLARLKVRKTITTAANLPLRSGGSFGGLSASTQCSSQTMFSESCSRYALHRAKFGSVVRGKFLESACPANTKPFVMVASSLFWHHAVMPVSLKPSCSLVECLCSFCVQENRNYRLFMVDGLMDDIVEPDDSYRWSLRCAHHRVFRFVLF